jgi:hypothetical protein
MDKPIYWDSENRKFYYLEYRVGSLVRVYLPDDPRILVLEDQVKTLQRIVMELDR